MRVLLFTDTLGDVNGVSRFIRNVAALSRETGRELTVFSSTRFPIPREPNIINFRPPLAFAMPGYPTLQLAVPPVFKMLAAARSLRPDVIHLSTPGPVGAAGWLAAAILGVPRVGVYHTDFPAYIDRLFDHGSMTWMADGFMRAFYRSFTLVLTRSTDYRARLHALGLHSAQLATLKPGIRVEDFARPQSPSPREGAGAGVGGRVGVGLSSAFAEHPRGPIRALYVGRISIEKNLPFLTRIWIEASRRLIEAGIPAELVIVGDGPYRAEMQHDLGASSAIFPGFAEGAALAAHYHAADFFIFPSLTDTLGQVVLEAQAAGLPVLISNIGGPKEVVRDRETGFILPHDQPEAWINAIVRVASDRARRIAMSRAAADHAARYSIADSFEHFWSIHDEARTTLGVAARFPV